jgi:hypothetical protein
MNKKIDIKKKADDTKRPISRLFVEPKKTKEEIELQNNFRRAHFELSDRCAFEAFGCNEEYNEKCLFQYYYENRLRIQCPFGGAKREICLKCPMMINTIGNKRHIQEEYAEIENVK